jgi:hypothetical protein
MGRGCPEGVGSERGLVEFAMSRTQGLYSPHKSGLPLAVIYEISTVFRSRTARSQYQERKEPELKYVRNAGDVDLPDLRVHA